MERVEAAMAEEEMAMGVEAKGKPVAAQAVAVVILKWCRPLLHRP